MKKKKATVCGVGINDADYKVNKTSSKMVDGKRVKKIEWRCPFYSTWHSMLERCYSSKFQTKNPTYEVCTVCDEWLRFSNFRAWMIQQDYRGKELDKDLLFKGNKVYNPETCVFVSKMLNLFFTSNGANRGKWLIGVSWHKETGKFRSQCNNPFLNTQEHLGLSDTELEAHLAWKKRKNELAQRYATKQTDERVIDALLTRFKP